MPNLISRLKSNWFGRFYLNYLKKIPFVRGLVILSWRKLYPVYLRTKVVFSRKKWHPLVNLSDHVALSNIPTIKVFDVASVNSPAPNLFPSEDREFISSPHDSFEFPAINIAQFSDAKVYGGTNFVSSLDAVICHDLFNLEHDYTSEELHGRCLINRRKKCVCLLSNEVSSEQIPEAAVFLDACAQNYAHWLTEVLPRVTAFCSIEKYASIPIIVNDGLHRNLMESLILITGIDREIITLPIGGSLRVDSLYVTSVTGYVPFEANNPELADNSHGLFSPTAFDLLRKRLLPFTKTLPNQELPKKIYLRRTSEARSIINGPEIEEIMEAKGYAIVETEKLSFLQQLSLFANSKHIAGPSGAAMANIIFAPPEASVNIFIGKYVGTKYWYWQNIALAVGNSVNYVLGDIGENKNIHANFQLDKDVIEEFIE